MTTGPARTSAMSWETKDGLEGKVVALGAAVLVGVAIGEPATRATKTARVEKVVERIVFV